MGNEIVKLMKQAPTVPNLAKILDHYSGQIRNALPRHMTPERMIRVALTTISTTPKLLECDPKTIIGSVVQSSILGLEPNSVLGQAYLIPYWNKKHVCPWNPSEKGSMVCQLQVGYKGVIRLAMNTGRIKMIDAQAVRAMDDFEFSKGLTPYIHHKWARAGRRGEIEGFWGGYLLDNNAGNFEYWSKEEVEDHRDKFSQNPNGTWKDHFEQMGRKTLVKASLKMCDVAVDPQYQVSHALALDDRAEAGRSQIWTPDVPDDLQPEDGDDGTEPPKPVVEEKPDAAAKNGNLTPKQQERIMALCADHKWNEKRLMGLVGALGYERLADVPAAKLDEILAEIGGGAQ